MESSLKFTPPPTSVLRKAMAGGKGQGYFSTLPLPSGCLPPLPLAPFMLPPLQPTPLLLTLLTYHLLLLPSALCPSYCLFPYACVCHPLPTCHSLVLPAACSPLLVSLYFHLPSASCLPVPVPDPCCLSLPCAPPPLACPSANYFLVFCSGPSPGQP